MESDTPAPWQSHSGTDPVMNPWRNWKERGTDRRWKGGGGGKTGNRMEKVNETTCWELEMVCRRIWGICYSDVCYGNPPFPWNLLEAQEESFWHRPHDCTHSLCRLDWTTKDVAHTAQRMQHGRTVRSAWGQGGKTALMLALIGTASHNNWSHVSLSSTPPSPVSSIPFLLIISFPSSMNKAVTPK